MRAEQLVAFWQEGQLRLRQADPGEQLVMERVIDELVFELRRRIGGPFTVSELAQLYLDGGTDWCLQLAADVAPRNPEAWDLTTVAGAAFARYAREAADFRDVGEREPR